MQTLLIDSQLLLLLVVGAVSPKYIAKHKRLTPVYTEADFNILLELVDRSAAVAVTPNTLTETSNLLGQIGDPIRTELFTGFAQVVKQFQEYYIDSRQAAEQDVFVRLGLADAAMLTANKSGLSLLTADLDLYMAAAESGQEAINFNHVREARESI